MLLKKKFRKYDHIETLFITKFIASSILEILKHGNGQALEINRTEMNRSNELS